MGWVLLWWLLGASRVLHLLNGHVIDLDIVVKDLSGFDGPIIATITTRFAKVSAWLLTLTGGVLLLRCTAFMILKSRSFHSRCGSMVLSSQIVQDFLFFLEDVRVLVRQADTCFIHLVD